MAMITIGMSCFDQFYFIDNFPKQNRKVFANSFFQSGGGPCGNAAYLLGKWGEKVHHITTMNNDISADFIKKEFDLVGVDLTYSIINENQLTPISTILIDSSANRTIINYKNNGVKIITQNDKEKLDKFINDLNNNGEKNVVLIDGHEFELSDYILSKLKNVTVIMDGGNVRESNLKLAKYTDYLVASESFAEKLIEETDMLNVKNQLKALKKIKSICKKGNTPVITLGEHGAISLGKGNKIVKYKAWSCVPVDTTGAGDIFHGAFCYGISYGWDLEKTIKFASLTSAISIEKKGIKEAMPDLSDVDYALLNNKYILKF